MDTILNTTVLSNFASVDALNLIKRLFRVVCTTHEVHEEILRGISRGYQYLEDVDHEMSFDETGWLQVIAIRSHTEHHSMNDLLKRLGMGESSCIAIAKSRKMIFMSDDRTARRIAQKNGVLISGTIGILMRCVDKNIISFPEGDVILAEMIRKGYMSPVNSLEEISSLTGGGKDESD
jgi:predicted nucleic acid-binding protein